MFSLLLYQCIQIRLFADDLRVRVWSRNSVYYPPRILGIFYRGAKALSPSVAEPIAIAPSLLPISGAQLFDVVSFSVSYYLFNFSVANIRRLFEICKCFLYFNK